MSELRAISLLGDLIEELRKPGSENVRSCIRSDVNGSFQGLALLSGREYMADVDLDLLLDRLSITVRQGRRPAQSQPSSANIGGQTPLPLTTSERQGLSAVANAIGTGHPRFDPHE